MQKRWKYFISLATNVYSTLQKKFVFVLEEDSSSKSSFPKRLSVFSSDSYIPTRTPSTSLTHIVTFVIVSRWVFNFFN